MKILVKVHKVDTLIEGQSDNGNYWTKQTVVFETYDTKPKLLAVDFFGDRKTNITNKLQPGQVCEVTFTITSREHNDRWYTQLDGVSITPFMKQGEVAFDQLPLQEQ